MIRWLLLVLLIPTLAHASTVVRCDPTDPKVANRVIAFQPSAHTPDFEGQPNTLINPTFTVTDPPFRYWKCSGSNVINMTAQEKTDLDAERNQREQQARDDLNEIDTVARAKLRQDFIDWDGMNPQQRQDATKNILRFLLLRDRIERGGQ